MRIRSRLWIAVAIAISLAVLSCPKGDGETRTRETSVSERTKTLGRPDWQSTLQATWIKSYGLPEVKSLALFLNHDYTYEIQITADPDPDIFGTYSLSEDRIRFHDEGGSFACEEGEGIYEYGIQEEFLTLTPVEDPCRERLHALIGTCVDSAAVELYDRWIEERPEDGEAYLRRGRFYTIMKQLKKATEDLDRAVELAPDDPEALAARGFFKAAWDGDFEGALEDLDRSVELDSTDVFAVLHRGFTKRSLGDLEGACEDWKKARDLGHPLVQEEAIDRFCE
jgi:hypothetical protein